MQTEVLIIGGGATGTGLARDLAMRGVSCVLAEQADINAGASGSNHGLLHSGARYVATDPETAVECRLENVLLKHLAPQCIEDTGGLFVAVQGDDEKYIADFPILCDRLGLPYHPLDLKEVREQEPALTARLIAAFQVEDANMDPFKLSLENLSHAQTLGAVFLPHTRVVAFKKSGHRIQEAVLERTRTGETLTVHPEQVVNAAGAWAGEVAALAGAAIDLIYSKGSLLVSYDRITQRVINRLHRPSDGDILVPGVAVSLLGTTSVRVESLADIRPSVAEIDRIVGKASEMLPVLETTRFTRAYAGVRPLIDTHAGEDEDDRSAGRGFVLLDHSREGVENFATISGGKLTTYRLMAEKAADLVCERLGAARPCRTRSEPIPPSPAGKWTMPGLSSRLWLAGHPPEDTILCACELVPKSTVEQVIDSLEAQHVDPTLRAVGIRSRMGKGPCQGAFCGLRTTAFMYDRGSLRSNQGLAMLTDFFRERWKGQRPVLWNGQLIQAELTEAIHCGLLNLELTDASETEKPG